jgi:hypothetical protein
MANICRPDSNNLAKNKNVDRKKIIRLKQPQQKA